MATVDVDVSKEEGRIIRAKAVLNRNQPFFARIILNMQSHEVYDKESIPTMGVNKYGHLFWNPDFVASITDEELRAVLAHEAMHVATLTFYREKNRNPQLWNVATDIAINHILVESGFSLPDMALIPENGNIEIPELGVSFNVSEMGAEEIYEKLEQKIKDKCNIASFDSHLRGDSDGQGGNTGEESGVDKDGNKVDKMSNQENEGKWKQVFTNSVAYAKDRGTLSGSLSRLCDQLLEPKLNWKQLLNQFITRDLPFNYSMSRPSRKFISTGIYQPITVKENLEVMIGIDVSGSISEEEYRDFCSEVVGICNGFSQIKARVMFWSTEVDEKNDIEIDNDADLIATLNDVNSTGGTELSCVAKYIEKKGYTTRLFVCLTDGYVENHPRLPEGTNLFVISKGGTREVLENYGVCCSLDD